MSSIQFKRVGSHSATVTTPSKIILLIESSNGEYLIKVNQSMCQKLKRSPFSMSVDSDYEVLFNASAVERSGKNLKDELNTIISLSKEVKKCINLVLKELNK